MDLLKQCQQWFEQDEAQKVIDTLEAIPAEERTPELDSELAKAYIAVAHIGEREPFEKALELLAPHEEYFAEDHCWNYRIASAYYFLDEEGPALRYFEKALKARPVILAVVLEHFLGIYGVYIACGVAVASSVPVGWWFYRSKRWMTMKNIH